MVLQSSLLVLAPLLSTGSIGTQKLKLQSPLKSFLKSLVLLLLMQLPSIISTFLLVIRSHKLHPFFFSFLLTYFTSPLQFPWVFLLQRKWVTLHMILRLTVTLDYPKGFEYGNSKLYKTFVKALEEITPDWIRVIAPPPTPGDYLSTAHPLGGVPLGRATDLYCRVKGYFGLYAVDGSIVPFPAGGNPYLTIVSLIERCMDNIIANDFLQ